MELFEPSASWIFALGKAIFHGLWIGFLVLSVLKLLFLLVPHRNAALRYLMALISLLILTGAFIVPFLMLHQPVSPAVNGVEHPGFADLQKFRLLSLFSYLYLAGLAVMILHTLFSIRSAHMVRNSGLQADHQWIELLDQLKPRLGINRRVGLLVSTRITSPGITGLFSPVILVPASAFTNLSVHQVEIILAHELYHIRRYDHVIHLVQLIIETLLFFHPAVWIISGMVRSEREHCIDDRVLQWCKRPTLYSKALYDIASEGRRLAALVPAAEGKGGYHLAHRIQRIHNAAMMKNTFRDKIHVLAFFVAAIAILMTTVSFSSPASSQISIHSQISEDLPSLSYQDTIPADGQEPADESRKPETVTRGIAQEGDEPPVPEVSEPAPVKAAEPSPPEEHEPPARHDQPVEKAHIRVDLDHDLDADVDHDFDADHDFDMEIEMGDLEMEMGDLEHHLEVIREELEEMDWEKIRAEAEKEVEAARREMENIDWESLKAEMEKDLEMSMKEMEQMDWEKIRAEAEKGVEAARREMENIDWEKIRAEAEKGVEAARREMENIDWESLKAEMEKDLPLKFVF